MNELKIYVACHKPDKIRQDGIHVPIHVGRSMSVYQNEMADMIGDDTGDNISDKNPLYCELTAQYWVWKNIDDLEYVGFCHYRRFFKINSDKDYVLRILSQYSFITLKCTCYIPIYIGLINFIGMEDFTILLMVLKKKYPDYEQSIIKYLRGNIFYPKNMFICKKEFFDNYASWLFDVLFECEKYMRLSSYTRARRHLAYIGEYLLSVYLIHNRYKIKVVKEEEKVYRTCRHIIGVQLRNIAHFIILCILKKQHKIEDFYDPAVLVGFKNDGIII